MRVSGGDLCAKRRSTDRGDSRDRPNEIYRFTTFGSINGLLAASLQASYLSSRRKRQASIIPLLLLSPKSLAAFRGPPKCSLKPPFCLFTSEDPLPCLADGGFRFLRVNQNPFSVVEQAEKSCRFLIGCGFDIFSKPQPPQIFRQRKSAIICVFAEFLLLGRRYPHIDSKYFVSHQISILSFICDSNDGCDGHFAIP